MTVILYSTGCTRCKVLERKLHEKGIEFDEFNDSEKMMEMGLQSVPVLSVDGSLMDFVEANSWINNYDGECVACRLS